MKYHTISTSSLASEGKKPSLTIYADMDISQSNKVTYTETEMSSIRGELEIVQKALKLQTKRCRQLVAEYTRRLQEKELQYQSERALRDDQLAKVLRALLIFEARLRQEQKFISHQLNEKDYIIKKQNNDIKKLLTNQYCKSCNQYCISSPILESLDSSSEYVVTDYQSSNFESLDSSSETYATVSEKGYNKSDSPYEMYNHESNLKSDTESVKSMYQKNRSSKDSLSGRRSKKVHHRKSIGTYFEVLKLRNDNASPISNEDNTSNDYDNLDSLPPESVTDKISIISENIESLFDKNQQIMMNHESESSPSTVSLSECTNTVIINNAVESKVVDVNEQHHDTQELKSKITDTIPVFEAGAEETNDNWYASASDPEDEEHRNVYRNNPVLECMNQILLQNMNDSLNSPPKTPKIERKSLKNKRVKFSDEEDINKQSENDNEVNTSQNYYETPIQKQPNFYETPQSIYSNDYEQILSKCSETFSQEGPTPSRKLDDHQFASHVENKPDDSGDAKIVRRSKIMRTPPALPPKPANLTAKYNKNQQVVFKKKSPSSSEKSDESVTTEFEPDYCSISELNLPQSKTASFKKISVVAEINAPTSHDVLNKLNPPYGASSSDLNNIDHHDNQKPEPDAPEVVKAADNVNDRLKLESVDIKEEVADDICKKQNDLAVKIDSLSKSIIPSQEEEVKSNPRLVSDNQKQAESIGKQLSKTNILTDNSDTNFLAGKTLPSETRRSLGHAAKMDILGKMYFTNESNINILNKVHSNEHKLKDKNQINDTTLVVKKCVDKLNIQLAKNTTIKSESAKRQDMEIPKLPQVSEIIIPDENDDNENDEERVTQDNYVKNNSQIFKLQQNNRNDLTRRPIMIGSSVSSLISGFNQQLLSEIKKKPERHKLGGNNNLFSSFENLQNSDKRLSSPVKKQQQEQQNDTQTKFDNFDLSQNFEEFKLDDCDLEEYTVEEDLKSDISDKSFEEHQTTTSSAEYLLPSTRVELIRATNDNVAPKLNKNSIELLKKQLEMQKFQAQKDRILNNSKNGRSNEPTYEHFLECTGLSSKSILTPSRLLSNHKSMLKPKDVKLRSKVKANNNTFERHSTSSVKYWTEPYI